MTLEQAKRKAISKAREHKEVYFVVWENGYQVANEFDLDTWFMGISDNNILFCADEWREPNSEWQDSYGRGGVMSKRFVWCDGCEFATGSAASLLYYA